MDFNYPYFKCGMTIRSLFRVVVCSIPCTNNNCYKHEVRYAPRNFVSTVLENEYINNLLLTLLIFIKYNINTYITTYYFDEIYCFD